MSRPAGALLAALGIALVTALAQIDTLQLGPAAAGLLYLLPVLWASARSGLEAGLGSAAAAAFCYNFFLLEPRYSLRIHGVGDVAAFGVLVIVAVVTSRLASDLRDREQEADARAELSAAEVALASALGREHDREALDAAALAFFAGRYGDAALVGGEELRAQASGLSPLDAAAAAWALHNGGVAGHASAVMPSADYRFIALGPGAPDVLALSAQGRLRREPEAAAPALARVWAQARDRLTADSERRAREAADEREGVRRALLAALGHDFRIPLTVLKGELGTLGGEAAARLGREVDRIARLGEDLIAAARLEDGQLARIEPIDLVDAVAAALPPAADGVTIERAVSDDLPLVAADPVMLTHLLGNLVENAVRHAARAVRIAAAADGDLVRVQVADDGPGIAPEVASALFDPFTSGTDRTGGSGLGLFIARDLARAMGGTLTAENRAEGGACFTLMLPVSRRA